MVCVCVRARARTWFQKLRYDLGDCAAWEFMFPSNDKAQQLPRSSKEDVDDGDDDEADFEVGLFMKLFL